jgi:hypothetical protein
MMDKKIIILFAIVLMMLIVAFSIGYINPYCVRGACG